jgi:hypothetical protein
MTFRGIYRDGIVVLGDIGLADGTPVDVNPSQPLKRRTASSAPTRKKSRAPRKGKAQKARSTRKAPSDQPLIDSPAIGMWEKRRDWKGKSTLDIASELRENFLGKRSGRRNG